jgi:two-component system, response regulator YesN
MFKLLIVDDEKMTRIGLYKKINWLEIGVTDIQLASNGLQALDISRRFHPNIIITDIKMPKMDGIKFIKELREDLPNCKIIFVTGYADKENLKSAIKLKVVEFVEKPINLSEIKKAVQAAIKEIKNSDSALNDYNETIEILP